MISRLFRPQIMHLKDGKNHMCYICDKGYKTRSSFIDHWNRKHY